MNRPNQWRRVCMRERIERLAPGYDRAHVEAWMRVHHDVIEALLPLEFEAAVKVACKCVDVVLPYVNDQVAERFGLRPKKRTTC